MSTGSPGGDTDRPLPGRTATPPAVVRATELVAVEQRGTTTLADKVVEKIAARAAVDVAHAGGLSRRVAGHDFGTPSVRANAEIDGHVASLQLELAVEYPASARATTRGVREHVTERVATLCDLTVDHIDITVAILRRADTERKRVQ